MIFFQAFKKKFNQHLFLMTAHLFLVSWMALPAIEVHAYSDASPQEQCDFLLNPDLSKFPLGISNYSEFISRYPDVIDQLLLHPEIKDAYSTLILSTPEQLKRKLTLARQDQDKLMVALKQSSITAFGRTLFDDPTNDVPKAVNLDLQYLNNISRTFDESKFKSNAITICLSPGKYTRQIIVYRKSNLRLLGRGLNFTPESRELPSVKIKPENYEQYGRDPDSKAVLTVDQSSNIVIENLRLVNKLTFTWTTPEAVHPISRAIQIYGSANVFSKNSRIVSHGKQTVNTRYSIGVYLENTSVSCYYFCITSLSSFIHSKKTIFSANYQGLPQDEHSLLWNFRSRFILENSTFSLISGRALVTGSADGIDHGDLTQEVILDGKTQVSGQFYEWLQQSKNYDGLNLSLYGDYPSGISPYFVNRYRGGPGTRNPIGQTIKRYVRGIGRDLRPELVRTIYIPTPVK